MFDHLQMSKFFDTHLPGCKKREYSGGHPCVHFQRPGKPNEAGVCRGNGECGRGIPIEVLACVDEIGLRNWQKQVCEVGRNSLCVVVNVNAWLENCLVSGT